MKNNNSIFGQMLQFISRYKFQKCVKEYQSEKHSKGFSSWSHFVSMLFGQLSGQDGLRGIETGMAAQGQKLYHLGVDSVKRSTLSYANNHRTHRVFKAVFESLLKKVTSNAPGHRFKFKNRLYSVDATTIDLSLGLYDWARFRKKKGGIKVHVKMNHSGYIPEFITVTTAKQHEGREIDKMQLKSGDVVAFDRAYTNYNRFATYCRDGIYFVTRIKKNANYKVIKRHTVSKHKNISSDQIIEMVGFYTRKNCPMYLRRIRVKDPKTGKYIVILTNQMEWSPATVAAVYKDRWQIEIFFKAMKQNLKIKSFLGTSRNAILIQIWTAMISYLLLSYLKFLSTHKWTIGSLMNVIPMLLFSRRSLWEWLNKPFGVSSSPQDLTLQMELL
ncbi:IS4 family transposase [Sediminispirochaeta bajacaliforniensis]|uniref:IS4 family transposase n=2 Tax=Sediminispirochaeta bajacaliforniensis TaxID=148 RepID=UPI00037168F5|nr:IS4 family transposase [Sediminispirochaeta bajacaliforniensis]